jgi:hypothetical protein
MFDGASLVEGFGFFERAIGQIARHIRSDEQAVFPTVALLSLS